MKKLSKPLALRLLHNKTDYTISEVAQILGISRSLIRFWEEEFELPKRSDETISKLEAAEIQLIYSLVFEKGMMLEDAKSEFEIKRLELEKKYKTIAQLEQIRESLKKLRDSFDEAPPQ